MTYRQPFSGEYPITQSYGEKVTSSFHTGIDYGCPTGTNILASDAGTVKFAGWDSTGYGNCVIIYHTESASTLYAHLNALPTVKVGSKVAQGDVIGLSGNSGNSTGPHLHFEARKKWNDYKSHYDPMKLPLTSVDDSVKKSDIYGADKLGQNVVVAASLGVYAHNKDFTSKEFFPYGTKLTFTGNTVERNGLTFCECTEGPYWIAVNDGNDQLLANQ